MISDLEHMQLAGEVLHEALDKLLGAPALAEFAHLPDEELELDMSDGNAPEIRDNARTILLARQALRSTASTIQNSKDVDASRPKP